MRLLGDQDEAEDVTQQVFLKLYHAKPHQLPTDKDKMTGWLYRVALHEGYNSLRSKKRRGGWTEKLNRLWVGRPIIRCGRRMGSRLLSLPN